MSLEDVITDSVNDALSPEPEALASVETPTEAPVESVETTPEAVEATPAAQPVTPTVAPVDTVKEDFDKKYGLQKTGVGGRENRLPYSRVIKITDNAVKDAKVQWEKDLPAHPAYVALDSKVKDYEAKFAKVGEFERTMSQDPDSFLTFLETIPAYKPFFDAVRALSVSGQTAQQPKPEAPLGDDMPLPDVVLQDGSKVYSEDGLRKYNAWTRSQARKETIDEVSKRYAPIEEEWQANKRIQAIIPQVQKQVEDAKKWPMFGEVEADVVKALQADKTINLEVAYNRVIVPKLIAKLQAAEDSSKVERNKIREEVIEELRRAPASTSVTSRATRPTSQVAEGGSLEDIIKASIAGLQR